jgi:O-antigen/teichoic acid export membrane protein
MIPLTLNYMGNETYGLWMAVTALTGMAAFADLGLGNGLMTKLAPCYAHDDHRTARTHISNAYAVVGLVAVLLLVVLIGTAGIVPWQSMLNSGASDPDRANASLVAVTCLAAFIANIPLSLVMRVQYAYQMVGQANIWQTTGSLWSIPLVAGAVHWDLGIGVVVATAVAGPLLANIANSVWLYARRLPELAPRVGEVDRRQARQLLGLGGQFLVLTIVMSIATNADQLVAAHTLGLAAVTTYSVPARLFGQLGILVSLVNLPLWPANGEALAKGDTRWVRTITRRMMVASAVAVALPGLAFVLLGDAFLSAWLGSDLGASPALMSGLALWWAMLASISPYFMVQNSVGVLMPQLAGWTLYLVVSVPLKIVAAPVFGLGGIVFAGVIPYALLVVPAAIWGYRTALRRAEPRSAHVTG